MAPDLLPGASASTHAADEVFMRRALDEAIRARELGEVPIGAVIARDGDILAAGHNRRETEHDPTAHAEIVAIRRAAHHADAWRLTGTTLYVTLEPCAMCAGALVQARVDRLVYGAADPKAGAVESLYRIVQDPRLNHRLDVTSGLLADECGALLRAFFQRLRT